MYKSAAMFLLVMLSACAANPPADPCTRQCNHVYNSCMDAGSSNSSAHAMERLNQYCAPAHNSCVQACRR